MTTPGPSDFRYYFLINFAVLQFDVLIIICILQADTILHCQLCPQKLLSKQCMKEHTKTEHGDLAYTSCTLCPLTFTLHQLLALHLYQTHGKVFRTAGDHRGTSTSKAAKHVFVEPPEITTYTFVEADKPRTKLEETKPCSKDQTVEDDRDKVAVDEEALEETNIYFDLDGSPAGDKSAEPVFDLPRGTTLIRATEDEILLEVDDTPSLNGLNMPDPVITPTPEVYTGPAQLTESKALENNQNVLIYLAESVVEVEVEEQPDLASKLPNIRRRKSSLHRKKHPCTWSGCDKTFVAKHSVNIHVRNVHMSESIECNQCGKSYSNEENLKVHIRTVHRAVSTPCKWPGCPRILSSERQMQSHFLKHAETPKNCPYKGCGSVLKNSSILRMHMKKMHGGPGMADDYRTSSWLHPGQASPPQPPTITTYKLK